MSFLPADGEICVSLQKNIDEVAAPLLNKRALTGALYALRSDYNDGAAAPKVDPNGDGHYRSIDFWYMQRATEDDIEDTVDNSCDGGESPGYLKTPFDVGLGLSTKFKIKENYIRLLCEGDGSFFARALARNWDALITKMDVAVLKRLWALAGYNPAAASSGTITYDLLDANGAIKRDVYNQMMNDNSIGNLMGSTPIAIGQGNAASYSRLVGLGCCNDGGTDVSKLGNNWALFTDGQMAAGTGDVDNVILLDPGTAKLAFWSKYPDLRQEVLGSTGVGSAFRMSNGRMRGIITDPMTGVPFDISIFPLCDDEYTVRLNAWFDVFVAPSDLYAAADPMSGYNGVLKLKIT